MLGLQITQQPRWSSEGSAAHACAITDMPGFNSLQKYILVQCSQYHDDNQPTTPAKPASPCRSAVGANDLVRRDLNQPSRLAGNAALHDNCTLLHVNHQHLHSRANMRSQQSLKLTITSHSYKTLKQVRLLPKSQGLSQYKH